MKSVDTNVLARLVLQDDPDQLGVAITLLERPVWVAATVWLELGWVLGTRLRMDRTLVADALQALLSLDTVQTGSKDAMAWAIERFRRGADWADMMHLISSDRAATAFVTFDRGIAAAAGATTPVPIETLA